MPIQIRPSERLHLAPHASISTVPLTQLQTSLTRVAAYVLAAGTLGLPIADAAAPIPSEAQKVIERVRAAAMNDDFMQLRQLMVGDFQWSFGGDADADQAIDVWKRNRKYVKNLKEVTSQQCAFIGSGIVECPGKGKTTFRAGFEKTTEGWRLSYFVEGD